MMSHCVSECCNATVGEYFVQVGCPLDFTDKNVNSVQHDLKAYAHDIIGMTSCSPLVVSKHVVAST